MSMPITQSIVWSQCLQIFHGDRFSNREYYQYLPLQSVTFLRGINTQHWISLKSMIQFKLGRAMSTAINAWCGTVRDFAMSPILLMIIVLSHLLKSLGRKQFSLQIANRQTGREILHLLLVAGGKKIVNNKGYKRNNKGYFKMASESLLSCTVGRNIKGSPIYIWSLRLSYCSNVDRNS